MYSLQGKGARVVTGRNLDDDGSQSNASGKSSLVMAPLWALTGRSDARAEVSGVPCLQDCGGQISPHRTAYDHMNPETCM